MRGRRGHRFVLPCRWRRECRTHIYVSVLGNFNSERESNVMKLTYLVTETRRIWRWRVAAVWLPGRRDSGFSDRACESRLSPWGTDQVSVPSPLEPRRAAYRFVRHTATVKKMPASGSMPAGGAPRGSRRVFTARTGDLRCLSEACLQAARAALQWAGPCPVESPRSGTCRDAAPRLQVSVPVKRGVETLSRAASNRGAP